MKSSIGMLALKSPTILLVIFLSGCGKSVTMQVETQVPKANMAAYKTHAAVHYSNDFKNYVFREESPNREKWEISIGIAQKSVFDQIFQSVFDQVTEVSDATTDQVASKLSLAPKLDEMQLATPDETGFTFYEAWLKYSLIVKHGAANIDSIITFTAYGKEDETRFMRLKQGLRQALEHALRDAGAKLTIELIKIQSEISLNLAAQ